MKVAIVGSEASKWKEEQIPKVKNLINYILWYHAMPEPRGHFSVNPVSMSQYLTANSFIPSVPTIADYTKVILVSGHCPKGGVDIWAEEIADELGIKKEIYLAEVKQWNDRKETKRDKNVVGSYRFLYGYRSRNIQIAEAGYDERKADIGIKIVGVIDDFVLYDIEPAKSCRHCGGTGKRDISKGVGIVLETCKFCEGDGAYSGGIWTLKFARDKLGRKVHKIVISSY